MNRLALTLAFALATYSAFAQAPFTIVRPKDGARVRETVRLLVPKNSVPPGGYIGIFIGGKFIEATIPPTDKTGKYYEYDLDTKAKQIPDGKLTLEAVLYVDYQERPRIVDRTSVEVTVANTAESKIPEKGLLLRYKYTPGTETVYDYTRREIDDISDTKKNELGAKPIEQSKTFEKFRILYACDNAYPNGDGLIRMQALPDKGKDSALVITEASPEPIRFYANEMHAVYVRVTSTGLVLWGSYPFAIPLEGTTGATEGVELEGSDPLPTLPFNPVKIGGPAWPSRFQEGKLPQDDERYTSSDFVVRYPARGEFKGVEWEMGHPCARIVNSLDEAVLNAESKKLENEGRAFTGNKNSEEETIWFALDKRQIIKVVRRTSFTRQVETGNSGFGGPPGGGPGATGAAPAPGPGSRNNDEIMPPPTLPALQRSPSIPPNKGGGRLGGPGRGTGGAPGRPGGAPASTAFVRVTQEETYILEQ